MMNVTRAWLVAVMALALLLASACGGTSDSAPKKITETELSLMVLALEDLGAQYAPFESGSGQVLTNLGSIDAAFDPEDERQDLDTYGRLSGYGHAYTAPGTATEGAAAVGTIVLLYEDEAGASGDMLDELQDLKRAVRPAGEAGTLVFAEPFDVASMGQEAGGILLAVSGPPEEDQRAYGTQVWFRRQNLLGVVAITRFDDKDIREEAAALARKLDQRMEAVLAGELTGPEAVPIR